MVRRNSIPSLLGLSIWMVCVSGLAGADEAEPLVIGANPDLAQGAVALTVGDYTEGIRLTERGLEAPPERSDRSAALSNLCAGLIANGNYTRALDSCNEAIEIDDTNWQAYNNRALTYYRLGRLAAAQEDVVRGLALNPTASQLHRVQQLVRNESRVTTSEPENR